MSELNTDDGFSSEYVDLVCERIGGRAIQTSDEWFAPAENLLKPGRGIYKDDYYISTGKWMDGWESRRSYGRNSRLNGEEYFDWTILRMGARGTIQGFDIDTNHFRGNAPDYVAVDAINTAGEPDGQSGWIEILPKVAVQPHSQNIFGCDDDRCWTHLRLRIYPDGGVARFRAYGNAMIAKQDFVEGELVDLASAINGGQGIDASDRFFSSPTNLIMPGRGKDMGDGWETKRRRDSNNDWAIVRLGIIGTIRKVLVDTAHFKGNYPDRMSLEAINLKVETDIHNSDEWETVIAECPLYPDREHIYVEQVLTDDSCQYTHVRLNIYPDGGISRLRILGMPDWNTVP